MERKIIHYGIIRYFHPLGNQKGAFNHEIFLLAKEAQKGGTPKQP